MEKKTDKSPDRKARLRRFDDKEVNLVLQAVTWLEQVDTPELSNETFTEFSHWLTAHQAHKLAFWAVIKVKEQLDTAGYDDLSFLELVLLERRNIQKKLGLAINNEDEMRENNAPADKVDVESVSWFTRIKIMEDDIDQKEFDEWLEQDKTHRMVYEELEALWDHPYFERALREKKEELELLNEFDGKKKSRKKFFDLVTYSALAASLAIAAFTAVINYTGMVGTNPPSFYQTTVGEIRTVRLADGSTVSINTNTQIHVDYSRDVRRVRLLGGKAYFDVMKDGRPFLVEGGTGLIRVMGTAFEVGVSSNRMDVAVERGRVAVSPLNDEAQTAEVTPNRRVAVARHNLGALEYQPLNARIADWRDGWLEFQGQALEEVIAELDEYYAGSITLNDEGLSRIRINVRCPISDIQKAVKFVAMSTNLNYSISNTGDIVFHSK